MLNCILLISFAVIGLHATFAHADALHFPLNAEIRNVRDLRAAMPAPDGKSVLAEITDSTADGGRPHLYIAQSDGKSFRQITFSRTSVEDGESKGTWSPDGRAVYFLAKRSEGHQVFRLSLDGGEATPITNVVIAERLKDLETQADVSDYSVSPDGSVIAFIAKDVTEPKGVLPKDDAFLVESKLVHLRLYMCLIEAEAKPRAVNISGNVQHVAWASDSARLVAVTSRREEELKPDDQAWLVSADMVQPPRLLQGFPSIVRDLAWLPGGDILVFVTSRGALGDPQDLARYELTSRRLTRVPRLLNDMQSMEMGGTGALMAIAQVGTRRLPTLIDPIAGTVKHLDNGLPVTFTATPNTTGTEWAFIASGPQTPKTLILLGRDKNLRLPSPDLVPADWSAVKSTLISWKSHGLDIEGLIYLPPDAQEAKVPLVINIHGGPGAAFSDGYSTLVNLLVGQGWAVLQPNIRGSTGYGETFEAANKDDLGGKDFEDVLMGVDAAIRRFPIDPDRLALIGYSYGGEIAAFAVGKTTRFKAIISGAPVTNQFSELGTEAPSGAYDDSRFFGLPWSRAEAALRQSPISYVKKAETPMLLVQGEADETDPMNQSQELYRALKMLGKPVEMIVLPRESHLEAHKNFYGETSSEPWHGVYVRAKMLEFLSKRFRHELTPASLNP